MKFQFAKDIIPYLFSKTQLLLNPDGDNITNVVSLNPDEDTVTDKAFLKSDEDIVADEAIFGAGKTRLQMKLS